MPHLQPVVTALDTSIRATVPAPPLRDQVQAAVLPLPKLSWIIELAAYNVSVNVLYFGNADFDPPPSSVSEDRTRYVMVTDIAECTQQHLLDGTIQAGRTPAWT